MSFTVEFMGKRGKWNRKKQSKRHRACMHRVECRLSISIQKQRKQQKNIEILHASKYVVEFNYPYEMCDVPGLQVEATEKRTEVETTNRSHRQYTN